jgi:glycosyltransferase involved in cell wall biosynthesis
MIKKKLLIITPRFPYPVIGGDRLRIFHICKFLSNYYQLTLVSLCESKNEMNMNLPKDGIFSGIIRVRQYKFFSYMYSLWYLLTFRPLQNGYFYNKKFQKIVDNLILSHDAVFCHLIRTADYVSGHDVVKFLEMTDAISLNYKRISKSKGNFFSLKKIIFSFEYKRLLKFEAAIPLYFNHSFVVSDVDRSHLSELNYSLSDFISVCSNGVDLSFLPYEKRSINGDIAFIGNMTSLQNIDAINFLIFDILPLLQKVKPNIVVRLIGRISSELSNSFASIPGVSVYSNVSSISDAVRGCSIGVCPIRLGAGIQNKVLEYMSLGLPCVTTTIGFEGLQAVPNRDLVVSDGAINFAKSIIDLLDDIERFNSLSTNALSYVKNFHSWHSLLQPIKNKIDSFI